MALSLFGTMYVSTFPVAILPEKQTAAEFLNNSKRIPMPFDFSRRNSLAIFTSSTVLFAWFVSLNFIHCKGIDPNRTNINFSFFQ